jgi:hypothetical protein
MFSEGPKILTPTLKLAVISSSSGRRSSKQNRAIVKHKSGPLIDIDGRALAKVAALAQAAANLYRMGVAIRRPSHGMRNSRTCSPDCSLANGSHSEDSDCCAQQKTVIVETILSSFLPNFNKQIESSSS